MRLDQIAAVVGGKAAPDAAAVLCNGVSTDSRKIEKGQLFVALIGENFDGNKFAPQALKEGAGACLVSEMTALPQGAPYILVDDTLRALGQLASYHRSCFDIPVVGITGSNGKTTTKDMLASILEQEGPVLRTQGNRNNEIGLPTTLLSLNREHKAAVVEMGMRGLGQIERLADIARPNIGVVTNVGETHIELLGTKEAIAKAKSELVAALPENGYAVLNGSDPYVMKMGSRTKASVCLYGMGKGFDVWADSPEDLKEKGYRFRLFSGLGCWKGQGGIDITIPLPGAHNVMNALAAAAAAIVAGYGPESVSRGLAGFTPTAMRMQIIRGRSGATLINDTYNASPASMKAALSALGSIGAGKKTVAVLADMLELGDNGYELHKAVGEYAAETALDLLVTVGRRGKYIAEGYRKNRPEGEFRSISFDTNEEAVAFLHKELEGGEVVLIKGSRGMKMEEVVAALS